MGLGAWFLGNLGASAVCGAVWAFAVEAGRGGILLVLKGTGGGGMAARTEGAVPRCVTVICRVEELKAAKTLRDHVGFALSFNLNSESGYSFNGEYGFYSRGKRIKINDNEGPDLIAFFHAVNAFYRRDFHLKFFENRFVKKGFSDTSNDNDEVCILVELVSGVSNIVFLQFCCDGTEAINGFRVDENGVSSIFC